MSEGAVIDGGAVSVMVALCVSVAELPLSSVAVQVTIVVPREKPSVGASFVTVGEGSAASLTEGVPSETGVSWPVPSVVIDGGAIIEGGMVSVIVTV
jgi:hypothetical protein